MPLNHLKYNECLFHIPRYRLLLCDLCTVVNLNNPQCLHLLYVSVYFFLALHSLLRANHFIDEHDNETTQILLIGYEIDVTEDYELFNVRYRQDCLIVSTVKGAGKRPGN